MPPKRSTDIACTSAWLLRALLNDLFADLTYTRPEAIPLYFAEISSYLPASPGLIGDEADQNRRADRDVAQLVHCLVAGSTAAQLMVPTRCVLQQPEFLPSTLRGTSPSPGH